MTGQVADLQSQLAALQAQMAGLGNAAAPTPAAPAPDLAQLAALLQSLGGRAAPAPVSIVGVSVPIKLQTPHGSVRAYLSLPAECGATPNALLAAIDSLVAVGMPVDSWQPSQSQGNGNSWGGNRGGYRR
jgi:hypothetical protein